MARSNLWIVWQSSMMCMFFRESRKSTMLTGVQKRMNTMTTIKTSLIALYLF